jgi:hypothetical protein
MVKYNIKINNDNNLNPDNNSKKYSLHIFLLMMFSSNLSYAMPTN